MARRVGIELSPSRCALVDLDERGTGGPRLPVRVRTFRAIPWSPHHADAFVATLRLLRKSTIVPARAIVALWDVDATYRHFSLPACDDARLRMQAVREVRAAAPPEGGDAVHAVLLDQAAAQADRVARDVTVVTAAAARVQARLAPLVAADFAIEAVITPAMALAAIARLLPGTRDDAARAYVAVNADATAVAIVRNGLLLLAREFALPVRAICGGAAGDERTRQSPDALDFARRLAPELKRSFLLLKQQSTLDVRQVVLCGEFHDLRALTAPLVTSLQVEVATLDTVQGLTPAVGAALATEVRDQAGALRVAWAAGAAGSPLASLLPPVVRRTKGDWRRSVRRLAPRAAALVVLLAVLAAGRTIWMRGGAPRSPVAGEPSPAQATGTNAPKDRRQDVAAAAAGSAAVGAVPRSLDAPVRRAVVQVGSDPSRIARAPQPRAADATVADAAAPDPVIDSILYGPDRRLALIDHRVVRVGDRVAAGVIADIEPKAVVVRRPSGELRRIEMKGAAK